MTLASLIKSGVKHCEIDPSQPTQAAKFSKKMSELVSILFAVVLAVGLGQILEYKNAFDFFVLLVAYLAVLCSWWGYHYGIIYGPPERNHISFFIDCAIVFVYWWLINVRSPFYRALIGYVAMFLLYAAWEWIRVLTWPRGRRALQVNQVAVVIAVILLLVHIVAPQPSVLGYIELGLVALGLVVYRYAERWAYKASLQLGAARPPVGVGAGRDVEGSQLLEEAREAMATAYAPISGYKVGAALRTVSGKVFKGCNIEFDNYSNTIHAEEAAIAAAVAAGEHDFVALAVVTSGDEVAWPCGMCRQSLFEIGGADLMVLTTDGVEVRTKSMAELLPLAFRLPGS